MSSCGELSNSWESIANEFLSNNAQLTDVYKKKKSLDIDFNIYIIFPDDNQELKPLLPKLEKILRKYEFNVVTNLGIDLTLLSDQSTKKNYDLFIIFCATDDVASYCLELVKDKYISSRILACIPDGDDSKFYCRRIREHYRIETVRICRCQLPTGMSCRCGIEILKNCINYLMDKVAANSRMLRIQNTVVILIHGIRTRAIWQSLVKSVINEHGMIAWPTNYGKFDLVRFLLPFKFIRKGPIDKINQYIKNVYDKHPNAEVSVLAHSFGTYIFGNILMNKNYNFDKIALCGSVLPVDYNFSSESDKFSKIVNEVGYKDAWPSIASKIGFGYGPTGSFGFNHGLVNDRIHANNDHCNFLSKEFCESYWIPFFCDGQIVDGDNTTEATPSRLLEFIDSIPGFLAKLILVLVLLIAFIFCAYFI